MTYTNDLRRWESRRRAIAEHYAKSGSLAVTAKEFGISRERVRQIVNKEGTDAQVCADREALLQNGPRKAPSDADG